MKLESIVFSFIALMLPFAVNAKEVNVKNFGARGDGVFDDSGAIQSAINAAGVSGDVTLPSGVYMLGTSHGFVGTYPDKTPILTALLINLKNVKIHGAKCSSCAKPILKLMDHKRMRVLAAPMEGSGFVVEDLIVDGNGANRTPAPWPPNSTQPVVGDVVDALVYGNHTDNFAVRNSEIRNGIEDAVGCWMCTHFSVSGNYLHDNGVPTAGGVGIAFTGDFALLDNNRIERNSTGIWLSHGAKSVAAKNNTLRDNAGAAFAIGGQPGNEDSGFVLESNTIEGNGKGGFTAIEIVSANKGEIRHNHISKNLGGIRLSTKIGAEPSQHWTIEDNSVEMSTERGVWIRTGSFVDRMCRNKVLNNGKSANDNVVIDLGTTVNTNCDK